MPLGEDWLAEFQVTETLSQPGQNGLLWNILYKSNSKDSYHTTVERDIRYSECQNLLSGLLSDF